MKVESFQKRNWIPNYNQAPNTSKKFEWKGNCHPRLRMVKSQKPRKLSRKQRQSEEDEQIQVLCCAKTRRWTVKKGQVEELKKFESLCKAQGRFKKQKKKLSWKIFVKKLKTKAEASVVKYRKKDEAYS